MTERDPERGEGRDPIDEEAAWAEIVAGYGEEPADPPGIWPRADEIDLTDTVDRVAPAREPGGLPGTPDREPPDGAGDLKDRDDLDDINDLDALSHLTGAGAAAPDGRGAEGGEGQGDGLGGPRDWEAAEDEDEGHFVPPEPPPLPETDLTTKLAWFAVIGGPLLLIGVVLFQFQMTWWLATLGIGGFLGGFATLVSRMRDEEDDEWPDPGSGAVV